MKGLLDTCTFIWLCAEPEKLSTAAVDALTRADYLFLSDVVIMEIAMKWQSGKLRLPSPPRYWIEEQTRVHQLKRLPIDPATLYHASELAPYHRDPFDRLLVAQAQRNAYTLITPDPMMHSYPIDWIW